MQMNPEIGFEMSYQAPIGEIRSYLKNCTTALSARQCDEAVGLDLESLTALLSEAGKLAENVLLPADGALDRIGASYANGTVQTALGHKEAYRSFVSGGWMSVSLPVAWGGQALPLSVNAACLELWHSGSMAFAMGTLLTMGAVETIDAYASCTLKQMYLPKLTTGEWAATMAMTEPQAGSDLGKIRTRAEPVGDDIYRISGTKIFISYGEHDLSDNIVHLVLARISGAPAGVQGLSLFLVPKLLPTETGGVARNDVRCIGIEKKLGQHGSPTCVMSFGENGGARGWLIGEANNGLQAMFTMMNRARLAVATQGVAVAERAFQKSLAYATEREQGRAKDGRAASISHHVDVQRMLGIMMSLTSAARAITFTTADAIDRSRHEDTLQARRAAELEADFLTPLAKAFCTDVGCDVASLAIQIHGGHGFVEETGVARLWRDCRIAPIYEGTNGIQAVDLAGRKLSMDSGETARRLLAGYQADARAARQVPLLAEAATRLLLACVHTRDATEYLLAHQKTAKALAGATDYLRLFALTAGAALLARAYLRSDDDETVREHYASCFRFFAARVLPETQTLRDLILDAADVTSTIGERFTVPGMGGAFAARLGT